LNDALAVRSEKAKARKLASLAALYAWF